MKRSRPLLGVSLLIAIFLWFGWDHFIGVTYRCRLTVEVNTPNGLRTGNSVIEVRTWEGIGFPGPEAGGIRNRVRGEAVVVELPGQKRLFVLLDKAATLLPRAYDRYLPDELGELEKLRKARSLDITAAVPRYRAPTKLELQGAELMRREVSKERLDNFPLFVDFQRSDDPLSVRQVDPDHLEEVYGKGFSLKRIFLQTTRDDVSRRIRRYIPWIGKYSNRNFSGNRRFQYPTPLVDLLNEGYFTTELR